MYECHCVAMGAVSMVLGSCHGSVNQSFRGENPTYATILRGSVYFVNIYLYTNMHMCIMYVVIYMYKCIYTHSKTSLNRPTMGPTLDGQFTEVVDLGS